MRTLAAFVRGSSWPPLVLVCGATLLATSPLLDAEFVWDDGQRFVQNHAWRGLGLEELAWMGTTFHTATYEPLAWITCALDHAAWGMDPFGYHLTSWLFHAGSAGLLFLVLVRFPGLGDGTGRWAAAAGALFFGVHPLRVEAVAWISARGYLVGGFFLLASMLVYLRAIEAPAGRERTVRLGLAWVVYVLALFGKPISVAFPVVLLALDAWPFDRLRTEGWRRCVREKMPFLAVAVPFALLAIAAKQSAGASYDLASRGLVERTVLAAYGVSFYPARTLLPVGLSPLYVLDATFPRDPAIYVLYGLASIGLTVAAWQVRRRFPAAAMAWLVYLLLVLPLTGFFQSGFQKAADRYVYLAGLPFAALAAAGVAAARRRAGPSVWAGAAVALAALGILSHRQTAVWMDEESLWRAALAADEGNFVADYHVGHIELGRGRDEVALLHFERAIAGNRGYDPAYVGVGTVLERSGRLEEALATYDAAIDLDPRNARAHVNRGNVLYRLGRRGAALESYGTAIEADPSYVEAWVNRGGVRLGTGDLEGAGSDLARALELDPGNARAHLNRGTVLSRLGRPDAAIESYGAAIEADPSLVEAWVDRGTLRLETGDLEGAEADLVRALELAPDHARARKNLARLESLR